MVTKTGIYFATRKTASAHVYMTKGKGKIRVNNVPIDIIEPTPATVEALMKLDLASGVDVEIKI